MGLRFGTVGDSFSVRSIWCVGKRESELAQAVAAMVRGCRLLR